ncbi:MAG: hypothetical protein HY960_02125 [Ignavibacteriae bacterium]|nr:hypothetical protein [Ignavibacteriota bacterium]
MNRIHSKEKIKTLVETYRKESVSKMNEAETRLRFIDPFFEALGWGIRNPNEVRIESTQELFEHQIKATDREIDELVYRLYGVTEDYINQD